MLNLLNGLIDRTGAKFVLGTLGVLLLNGSMASTQAQTVVIEYGSSSGGVRGTTSAIMGSPIPSPVPLPIDTYTSPGRSSDITIRYRRDWDDRDRDYDRYYDRRYRRDDDSTVIRRTQIRDSTLINPVIIDSSIRDSTLVNPTIIDNNRYWNDDSNGFDWERYNADSAIIFSSPDSSVFVEF